MKYNIVMFVLVFVINLKLLKNQSINQLSIENF